MRRDLQVEALDQLLNLGGTYGRGPWVPAGEIVAATWCKRASEGLTTQAIVSALKSLEAVGLAERCKTAEGAFWKATDAAERADQFWRFDDERESREG